MEVDDEFVPGIESYIDPLSHALSFEQVCKSFLAVDGSHAYNAKTLICDIAGIPGDHFGVNTYVTHMCIK